jgi:hypothetical protein
MQTPLIWIGLIVLLTTNAYAGEDERVVREKQLIGSWQLQDQSTENSATRWIFAVDGGNLQITQLDGDTIVTKSKCSTNGSTCELKAGGNKGMISMWYNGTKLVQMETHGSVIIKRRFAVLSPGNVMEMEVIRIVPSGNTETFRFRRLQASAQSK